MKFTRRTFLWITASATSVFGQDQTPAAKADEKKPPRQWFKGNLHMHTQWSDGAPMPEWAVNWYKTHGYHFICVSDHNGIQTEEWTLYPQKGTTYTEEEKAALKGENSRWKPIGKQKHFLTQAALNDTIALFGKETIRSKKVGKRTFVRLMTFKELEKRFCEPDKFLMIPGFEQTGAAANGQNVHMNFINVRKIFPYQRGKTTLETIRKSLRMGRQIYGRMPYLFTVNHPMWKYYDISPQNLIDLPQVWLFELTNNGIHRDYQRHPQGWQAEKFWDVVNAYRVRHSQRLLFGMGSDDRHDYAKKPRGWTIVRADRLSTAALFDAIQKGDFYCSNGMTFRDIHFDGKALSVQVQPPKKGKCRILFIGTKKDYDPKSQPLDVPASKTNPARTIDRYSDTIGVTLATVDGLEGAYTLQPDDLYVRVKIVCVQEDGSIALRPCAWTQPYTAR